MLPVKILNTSFCVRIWMQILLPIKKWSLLFRLKQSIKRVINVCIVCVCMDVSLTPIFVLLVAS